MEGEHLARELASLHAASWGWALACCGRDAAVASDVLQQAYWKVLEGKARWDARASLKTWFFSVIRLTSMEQRRSILRWWRGAAGPAPQQQGAEGDVPASSSEKPDRAAAHKQTAEALSRALSRLAPRQRQVLHLVFYEELTIADAAAIMGVSVGSARQHYDRGKKNLKELLADEDR
jgi:RNA polymerase sigma factor (sigma-70 family)